MAHDRDPAVAQRDARQLGHRRSRLAEAHVDPVAGQGVDRRARRLSPERVERHVEAPVRGLGEAVAQLLGPDAVSELHRCVGAERPRPLQALEVATRRHHASRSHQLGELDRDRADGAGRAGDQDVRTVERSARGLRALEAHERGEHRHAERGGRRVVELVTDGCHRRLRGAVRSVRLLGGDGVLGNGAVAPVARVDELHAHTRAGSEPLALLDHAHALEPDHVGRLRRAVEEVTVPDVELDRVQRGGPDPDQRLARPPLRLGNVCGRRRAAQGLDDCGAHLLEAHRVAGGHPAVAGHRLLCVGV